MNRERLVRRVIAVVAGALLANLLVQPWRALHDLIDTDFLAFLSGARILALGSRCVYCVSAQQDASAALSGLTTAPGDFNTFVNPPPAALLLVPLTRFEAHVALGIFLVAALLAVGFAAYLIMTRLLPSRIPVATRATVAVTALASAPASWAFALAQWDPFIVLGLVGAVHQLRRGRPVLAGLLLSVGCIKPQLIWMVPVMLLVGRGWRSFAGMAMGTAVFLLSAVVILGDHLLEWPRLMFGTEVPLSAQTAGLPGLAGGLAGSPTVSVATTGVLAIIVVYMAWRWRRRLIADPEMAMILGIGASLLLTPHVFSDDFLLLAIPLVVWAERRPQPAILWALALSAAYLVDLQLPAALAHLEAPVGLAIVLGFARDRLRKDGAEASAGARLALSRFLPGHGDLPLWNDHGEVPVH